MHVVTDAQSDEHIHIAGGKARQPEQRDSTRKSWLRASIPETLTGFCKALGRTGDPDAVS